MKSHIITIAILAAVLILVSEAKILFNPFKVTIEKPALIFAWIFLIVSLSLFNYQSKKDGKKELMGEVIKELNNQKKK